MRRFLGASAAAAVHAALPAPATPNVDAQRYLEGRRFFYIYQTPNIASLAAAATTTNVIQFDIDSVFVWMRTCVVADIAGAVQTTSSIVIPLATLQITDTGTGTNFFNNAVPLTAIAGDGRLPFVQPTPVMCSPAASFQFTWNNYSAATTYANLRLQLVGFKVYGNAPPAQFGG